MSDFDHDAYTSSLEIVLKAAQEDYKQITFDRRRIQHSILRNYLWLATAIFSAECTFFFNLTGNEPILPWPISIGMFFYTFAGFALSASLATFAFGIDSMRGRAPVFMPYEYTYEHLMDMAHKEASNDTTTGSLMVCMIRTLESAINHHREIAVKTGKRLRWLSRLLLGSIFFALLAVISASIKISGN